MHDVLQITPADVFDYEERLREAVRFFWAGCQNVAANQDCTRNTRQACDGTSARDESLDAFRDMIGDVVRQYGPKGCEMHRDENMTLLPPVLRQTNPRDMVIVFQNQQLAAIELKSRCGPTFSITSDRRCEEAISSGYEFRNAQGAALFGRGASPFLGYFILVEDSSGSREPVSAKSPHFPTGMMFHSSSCQQRKNILCDRMVEQQFDSCASVLITPNESKSGDSAHLSNQTAFRFLLSRLAGHLASETDLAGKEGARFQDEPAFCESGSLLAGDWFASIENTEEATPLT